MRIELVPVILGALVVLIGLGLLADAALPDRNLVYPDRRRRARAERSRPGEGVVALGVLCLGAALVGRDTWRFGTVAVLAGMLLVLVGTGLNLRFLRELIVFRGPARRADPVDQPPVADPGELDSR